MLNELSLCQTAVVSISGWCCLRRNEPPALLVCGTFTPRPGEGILGPLRCSSEPRPRQGEVRGAPSRRRPPDLPRRRGRRLGRRRRECSGSRGSGAGRAGCEAAGDCGPGRRSYRAFTSGSGPGSRCPGRRHPGVRGRVGARARAPGRAGQDRECAETPRAGRTWKETALAPALRAPPPRPVPPNRTPAPPIPHPWHRFPVEPRTPRPVGTAVSHSALQAFQAQPGRVRPADRPGAAGAQGGESGSPQR